ncbi:MAG TPA: PAS domain S-box protein, partial [Chitinophagaceae bacterium]|nr:PAS domain S-box protein [Chitinophagaceae bacterium]
YRWVLDIGVPRVLDDGTFLGYIGSIIDIHDQKLKEDQLIYQANILANVSDSVIITDLDYRVLSWNSVSEEIFGVTAEEAIGKRTSELVALHYADDETYESIINEFESKGRWKGETFFINRKGEHKYLLNTVTLVSDNDGRKVSVMSVGSDITELKKAQEQLQQSELFYRNLIGNSLDGILLTDSEGRITFCAPSVKNILGYDAAEAIGTNVFSYVHPEEVYYAKGSFLDPGPAEYITIRLLKKSGEWLWCMVRGHNLLDNEEVGAYIIYLHDDTLRKKAEDELKESEMRLRTAQEIAGLGYMEMDETGQLYCSEETSKVLALDAQRLPVDLAGFLSIIHPADIRKVREDIKVAFEKGASFHHEFRIQFPDAVEKI